MQKELFFEEETEHDGVFSYKLFFTKHNAGS